MMILFLSLYCFIVIDNSARSFNVPSLCVLLLVTGTVFYTVHQSKFGFAACYFLEHEKK